MGQKRGYKQTIEHKNNLSLSLKKAQSVKKWGFAKGHKILGFKGKKHTEEYKLRMSKLLKLNNPAKREDVKRKISKTRIINKIGCGEKNPNWKGGRSKYRGADWCSQRRKVLERDNFTCQVCGKKQSEIRCELTVHHIIPYHDGGSNDLPNLKTVCISCHFSIEPRLKKDGI